MDYFKSGDLVVSSIRLGWPDRVGVFIKFVGGPIFENTDRCCEVLFRSRLNHYLSTTVGICQPTLGIQLCSCRHGYLAGHQQQQQ